MTLKDWEFGIALFLYGLLIIPQTLGWLLWPLLERRAPNKENIHEV
jgi:hypothetical protein